MRRTLVVGRGISIQGTVQDAERPVVEGTVEATTIPANELSIAQGGCSRATFCLYTRFPRAIAGVISELRLARLSPDDVASIAPDVAPLLAAYEAELAEMHVTDWAGILAVAAEGAPAHRLSGLPVLMLDVPITSEAELAFVRSLGASARNYWPRCRRRMTDTRPVSRPAALVGRGSRFRSCSGHAHSQATAQSFQRGCCSGRN